MKCFFFVLPGVFLRKTDSRLFSARSGELSSDDFLFPPLPHLPSFCRSRPRPSFFSTRQILDDHLGAPPAQFPLFGLPVSPQWTTPPPPLALLSASFPFFLTTSALLPANTKACQSFFFDPAYASTCREPSPRVVLLTATPPPRFVDSFFFPAHFPRGRNGPVRSFFFPEMPPHHTPVPSRDFPPPFPPAL